MSLPVVSGEYIDGLFTEMEGMGVELDDDPLEYGPRRLSSKVAETRHHLSRCEQMSLQVGRLLQQYKRAFRALQLDFELQMKHLLANDPEVRAGRNVADRNAIATVKLSDIQEQISSYEIVIQDLEAVNISIKSKRSDLKDVQTRLRDQMRLCQEEVGLGGRWGDRKAVGVSLSSAPLLDQKALDELASLNPKGSEIQFDPEELLLGQDLIEEDLEEPIVEEEAPSEDKEDFDFFLESVPDSAPLQVESEKNVIDIDSLLASFDD